MVRRIEVSGAGGVRLAAWDFGQGVSSAGPRAYAGRSGRAPRDTARGRRPAGPARGPRPASRGRTCPGGTDAPPAVLLLHGLTGRASQWAVTADGLSGRYRPVALDQRGHGCSAKPPDGYGREEYVRDAEAAIEQLGLAPAALVGHAMGALTAWQLAVRRPDLVRSLVICDMRASALGEASQREWERWFASWPLPFATLAQVRAWFGELDPTLERPRPTRGAFYTQVMERREGGWWPSFSFDHVLRSREPWMRDAHWEELAEVACPTLVLRGWDGELGRAEAQEMVRVLPRGRYAEVPEAGHLVPWDQPEAWQREVEAFLGPA